MNKIPSFIICSAYSTCRVLDCAASAPFVRVPLDATATASNGMQVCALSSSC